VSEQDEIFPVKRIDNWKQFEEAVYKKELRKWVYRGHSNANWKLESSFYRLLTDMQEIIKAHKGKKRIFNRDKHEQELLSTFKSQAHLYLDSLPNKPDDLEWLCLMQHYGTPTRLLDMTFSPYVAAFFALETGHGDCCVYAIDHKYFTDVDSKHFGHDEYANYKKNIFVDRRGSKSFFLPYEPAMKSERLVAQQGLFLVSSTNYQTYDNIIDKYELSASVCTKYVLSSSIRYEGLRKLSLMNINSATLFPGIDGFCRSLKFQVLNTVGRLKRVC